MPVTMTVTGLSNNQIKIIKSFNNSRKNEFFLEFFFKLRWEKNNEEKEISFKLLILFLI